MGGGIHKNLIFSTDAKGKEIHIYCIMSKSVVSRQWKLGYIQQTDMS